MFLAGSSDDWIWSSYFEQSVDFCVHALQRDGLRVDPFVEHPDGDGRLRDAGLDTGIWRTWLATVVDVHARLSQGPWFDDTSQDGQQHVIELAESFSSPWRLCPGPTAIQVRIEALWSDYEMAADARRSSDPTSIPEYDLMNRLRPDGGARIWRGLQPYHDRLSTLNVYLVEYASPAVLTMPPLTCVIAPAGDPETYARQVITAAETLARL